MDLTERIARLIDPDAWKRPATMEAAMGLHTLREESLVAARRVIDGLNLHQDIFRTYAGNPVHHLIRGHIDTQEDA